MKADSVLGEAPSGWTRIEIADVPPSQNVWDRMHRMAKPRLRNKWAWNIKAELSKIKIRNQEKSPLKMSVTIIIWHKRLYDDGNAWGGCKPVWDAMKDAGLIYDDSPKWIDKGVSQMLGEPRTVIEFRECK